MTLDKVLKRLNVLDEKHEKLTKTIAEKVINSQYVEAEYVEEDWSNEGMNIYFTKYVKDADEMVVVFGLDIPVKDFGQTMVRNSKTKR